MSMGVDDVGRAFTAQHEYLKLHCWQSVSDATLTDFPLLR